MEIISYSQLRTLQECEFKWHLSYEEGWKVAPKGHALYFGSTIHDLFDVYYKAKIDGVDDKKEIEKRIRGRVQDLMPTADGSEQITTLMYCAWIMSQYIEWAKEKDAMYNIASSEGYETALFETPKGRKFVFEMRLDQIFTSKENGTIWLVENKSTSKRAWTPTEMLLDVQTPMYLLGLRKKGVQAHGILFTFINSYQYKKKEDLAISKIFQREPSYRTEEELDNMYVEVGEWVDHMIELQDSPIRKRHLRKECERCWFNQVCLANLKGRSINQVLEGNDDFTRKKS